MLSEELRSIKSSPRELRKFGLTLGIAFLILAGLLLWFHRGKYPYFIGLGVLFIGLGLAAPSALKLIQKPWMMLSVTLGWFVTRMLMGLMFVLVFTPIGFITRSFGKQYLDLKIDENEHSYWKHRENREFDAGRCERQY